jgi:SAM-dependent methyltransferase
MAGHMAHGAAQKLAATDPSQTLSGDRWLEWSYCLARLSEGPGRTLDFGAVVALDRLDVEHEFSHERVQFVVADILDRPLEGQTFDQIVNCSSVEHVGLPGRYESTDRPDGDLEAMAIMRESLAPDGRMVMTIPVGRDQVCRPLHRIYGAERLPRLTEGYTFQEEQYWWKAPGSAAWSPTDRETALATEGSESFYSLGLFVLGRS